MSVISRQDRNALKKIGITDIPSEKKGMSIKDAEYWMDRIRNIDLSAYPEGSYERADIEAALKNLRAKITDLKFKKLRLQYAGKSRIDGSCIYSTGSHISGNDIGRFVGTRL